MEKRIIDISKHQGHIDFRSLKPYVDGVIIRSGFGWYNKDPMFTEYIKQCSLNGIPFGIYFFSYATNMEQARWEMDGFLAHIKGIKAELPICIDMEDDGWKKRNGNPSMRQLADILYYQCKRVQDNGYYSMFYTSKSWVDQFYRYKPALKNFDLWLAHWYDKRFGPSMPCGIWQYGSRVINGKTYDGDIAYKDYPAIIHRVGLNGWPPSSKKNPIDDLTDLQLASQIYEGRYGNGETRKQKLGSNYYRGQKAVQRVEAIIGDLERKQKKDPGYFELAVKEWEKRK